MKDAKNSQKESGTKNLVGGSKPLERSPTTQVKINSTLAERALTGPQGPKNKLGHPGAQRPGDRTPDRRSAGKPYSLGKNLWSHGKLASEFCRSEKKHDDRV